MVFIKLCQQRIARKGDASDNLAFNGSPALLILLAKSKKPRKLHHVPAGYMRFGGANSRSKDFASSITFGDEDNAGIDRRGANRAA